MVEDCTTFGIFTPLKYLVIFLLILSWSVKSFAPTILSLYADTTLSKGCLPIITLTLFSLSSTFKSLFFDGLVYFSLAIRRGYLFVSSKYVSLYPAKAFIINIHDVDPDLKTLHHTREYFSLMKYSHGLMLIFWIPCFMQAFLITILLLFISSSLVLVTFF